MGKAKPKNKMIPKKTTRFTGETKLEKENEKALKVIQAIKGMFG
jgi:hypothetical protein